MKKIILFCIVFLLCSSVWAQLYPIPNPGQDVLDLIPSGKEALNWRGGLFDSFYAPSVLSTESRYSAGIFTNDIDEYLDVTLYDPKIGTFLFMGGYPAGNSVNDTDNITHNYAVNFGFAKTINCYYFGIYYGGSLVDVGGGFKAYPASQNATYSSSTWQNNLAVILGSPFFGAFRFDLKMNTKTEKDLIDDTSLDQYRKDAPSIALTWGGIKVYGFDPYITVGYKFAEKEVLGGPDSFGAYKEGTFTGGDKFGVQAGVNYDFNENSKVWGDISFVKAFSDKYSGDEEIIGADPSKELGGWGIGLRAAYKRIFNFGKISAGLSPGLFVAYTTDSYNHDPSNDILEICTSVDLGLKYQHCAKLAFYTGASLQILDWVVSLHSDNDDSGWFLGGFAWDNRKWSTASLLSSNATSYLGFGMTVTPVKNLIIGAGLNTFLDKFVVFDLKRMSIETGEFFDDTKNNPNNTGTWFGNLFNGIKFDLTVSYKF